MEDRNTGIKAGTIEKVRLHDYMIEKENEKKKEKENESNAEGILEVIEIKVGKY